MDTSPEYINMCRRAKELQEMWEPEPGDFYKLPGHFITCIVLKNSLIDMDAIWLPRIDQYCDIGPMGWAALAEKCICLFPLKKHGLYLYPTFERAAIAVIMKNMFYKSWNGEDWRI